MARASSTASQHRDGITPILDDDANAVLAGALVDLLAVALARRHDAEEARQLEETRP